VPLFSPRRRVDTPVMRWFLTATMATLAALVIWVPSAAAAVPERTGCAAAVSDSWCFLPAPDDWEQASSRDFWSCPSCQSYGQQGIEQGWWSDYHCEGRVQGIDYYYRLYVPPLGEPS
jgi:hypothetical protein